MVPTDVSYSAKTLQPLSIFQFEALPLVVTDTSYLNDASPLLCSPFLTTLVVNQLAMSSCDPHHIYRLHDMQSDSSPDLTEDALEDDQLEEVETLPDAEQNTDPLIHVKIRREISGQTFLGQVVDIGVGKNTRDQIYLVRDADGNLEHFSELQVKEYSVMEAAVLGKRVHAPADPMWLCLT